MPGSCEALSKAVSGSPLPLARAINVEPQCVLAGLSKKGAHAGCRATLNRLEAKDAIRSRRQVLVRADCRYVSRRPGFHRNCPTGTRIPQVGSINGWSKAMFSLATDRVVITQQQAASEYNRLIQRVRQHVQHQPPPRPATSSATTLLGSVEPCSAPAVAPPRNLFGHHAARQRGAMFSTSRRPAPRPLRPPRCSAAWSHVQHQPSPRPVPSSATTLLGSVEPCSAPAVAPPRAVFGHHAARQRGAMFSTSRRPAPCRLRFLTAEKQRVASLFAHQNDRHFFHFRVHVEQHAVENRGQVLSVYRSRRRSSP